MRKILSILMCLVLSACMLLPISALANSGTTVYITKTGECYHNAGCQYLKKSCIPIALGDAVSGGYRACSRCNPPALVNDAPAVDTYTEPDTKATTVIVTPKVTTKPMPTPMPISTPRPSAQIIAASTSTDGQDSTALYVIVIIGVGAGVYYIGKGRRRR